MSVHYFYQMPTYMMQMDASVNDTLMLSRSAAPGFIAWASYLPDPRIICAVTAIHVSSNFTYTSV